MIREQTDARIEEIRNNDSIAEDQKQILIDEELKKEIIPIRAENKKAIIDGLSFLAVLFTSMAIVKYFLLPLILA